MKTVAFLALIALSALAGACTQSPTSPAPERGARWEVEGDTTPPITTQSDTTRSDTTTALGGGHSVGSGG